ncbi:MAG: DUF1573 domain-containing protein [Rikenellaceae bacterium]
MKRLLIMTLMLLSGVAASYGATPAKGALIEMDTVAHDFGRVSRKGADIIHTFTARNIGDAPLVITEGSTTCTCIKVKHPKRPIAPNSEAKIEVEYELGRKEVGPFYKVIKILSNSADGGCQVLTIQGVSVEE